MTFSWTQKSGYVLGEFADQVPIAIPLPTDNFTNDIVLTIISGELPSGLTLNGDIISGTPSLVSINSTYSFCVRATFDNTISDRTFYITINGNNPPSFTITSADLDIGIHHQYFAIEGTYTEYQLNVVEPNVELLPYIRYYISEGALPPGLVINEFGLISGIITPIVGIAEFFNFNISVTDSVSVVSHSYRIYVVKSTYLTADNTNLLLGNHLFTADVTKLKPIQWISTSFIGTFRANNYITLPIKLLDVENITVSLIAGDLPSGMTFNSPSVSISGYVPSSPAFSSIFSFTLQATRTIGDESISDIKTFSVEIIGEIDSFITWDSTGGTGAEFEAEVIVENGVSKLLRIKVLNEGSGYDGNPKLVIIPTNGGINASAQCIVNNGNIKQVIITNAGTGYITAPKVAVAEFLGSFHADLPMPITIQAGSSTPYAILSYQLIDGALPPGFALTTTGDIIRLDETETTFDSRIGFTIFDQDTEEFDVSVGVHTFTVEARDQYAASYKSFYFELLPETTQYSNISVRPLLSVSELVQWRNFINNASVFPSTLIYKANDPLYGIRKDMSMLIYAGIETSLLDDYAIAMENNHKRKRFQFGTIKTAIAINENTFQQEYEIIYIEMFDMMEKDKSSLPSEIVINNNNVYYPSSVSNWQYRLQNTEHNGTVLKTERNYLPLWMRSVQPGMHTEQGFTLAIPICYCKVGASSTIVANINNYLISNNMEFNDIDYSVDRYIIDDNLPYREPKYLVFNNKGNTI